MNCPELQDRLWDLAEPPDDARAHLAACADCASARDDIARLRADLRGGEPVRLEPGVLARMSKPRAVPWRPFAAAAALAIAAIALLTPKPVPPVVVRIETPPTRLEALLKSFDRDPAFEETLIHVLNETLRRRSAAPDPVVRAEEVLQ